MPRYRLVWLEIAEAQYQAQTAESQAMVDRVLVELVREPTKTRGAIYERGSDQWSVPLGSRECLVYAVVADPPTLIVERIIRLAPAHSGLSRIVRSWVGRRWFWPQS